MDEHAVVPREAAAGHSRFWTGRIAAEMQGVMQEIGGDGFLSHDPLTRKAITEVTDGLAPALLQQRVLRNLITHARRFARICWCSDRYPLATRGRGRGLLEKL
jgi:hypothetical protein